MSRASCDEPEGRGFSESVLRNEYNAVHNLMKTLQRDHNIEFDWITKKQLSQIGCCLESYRIWQKVRNCDIDRKFINSVIEGRNKENSKPEGYEDGARGHAVSLRPLREDEGQDTIETERVIQAGSRRRGIRRHWTIAAVEYIDEEEPFEINTTEIDLAADYESLSTTTEATEGERTREEADDNYIDWVDTPILNVFSP